MHTILILIIAQVFLFNGGINADAKQIKTYEYRIREISKVQKKKKKKTETIQEKNEAALI